MHFYYSSVKLTKKLHFDTDFDELNTFKRLRKVDEPNVTLPLYSSNDSLFKTEFLTKFANVIFFTKYKNHLKKLI